MGERLRAAFAALFLIGLLASISYSQTYPCVPYINYSQISPGFVPYPACEPLTPSYEQCGYPARIAMMKPNTGLCDYDYVSSLFVVDSFSFGFQLPKKYALEVTMLLDDCRYSTDGVSLALNGRCTATTPSSCRSICNSPSSYRTFTFDESCSNEGANAIYVRGYVSNPSGISQARLGSASCPIASCGREFNIYAYISGKQKEQALVASGSYSIADAVTYSFSLANTPDPVIADGQGPLLEARLPTDSFSVVIGNATVSSGCPGPQCNFSSGLLSTPIAGELSLSYSVPKINVHASFSDNEFSAYFPGDCANITPASSVSGVPNSPHYALDGSAFSGCAPVNNSIGSHSFAISAYDEPHGHRGEISLQYSVEPFPTPTTTESVIGSTLAVTFAIPKSHITYTSPINYQLPADFTGETPECGPCEIHNGSLIIIPNCPPYSDCSFPVKLKIKNITYSVSNAVPPSAFIFGQPVTGYVEVSAFNTNPIREMPLVIGTTLSALEVQGGKFETNLIPLERKDLRVPVLLPNPLECGKTESASGDVRKVSVCMQFPENFPKIQGAYSLRARGLPQKASAFFDGASVPVSVNGEILTATFASLPGIHNLAFSFEAEAVRPNANNETVENKTANTNAYVPESKNTAQPLGANAQRNITFLNKLEANFGEPVEIIIYENGSPASGLISVFSPSGKEFQARVEGGIFRFTPYEEGVWAIEFAGISAMLRVSGATANSETGGVPRTKSAIALPEIPQISAPAKGDYLVFLLIPLIPIPILAVVIAHFLRTPAISINKRRENGKITLIIENGNAWLEEVFVNDSAPEGSTVSEFGNASITESITGTRLKWRLPSMKPRQVWAATYRISPESETLSRANLAAFTEKGKEIRISSN